MFGLKKKEKKEALKPISQLINATLAKKTPKHEISLVFVKGSKEYKANMRFRDGMTMTEAAATLRAAAESLESVEHDKP